MRFLILLILLASNAFAQEQEVDFPVVEDFFLVGLSVDPKIKSEVQLAGVSSRDTTKQKAKPAIGFDIGLNFHKHAGISLLFDWTQFKSDDPTAADSLLFLGIGPRGRLPVSNTNMTVWGMVGVGVVNYQYGAQTQIEDGFLVRLHESNTWGLMGTARAGIDFKLVEQFSLRIQGAYSEAKISENFTMNDLTNNTELGKGDFNLKPSWGTVSIGIMARF